MTIYYKVCYVNPDGSLSSSIEYFDAEFKDDFSVKYSINNWTVPKVKNTKLFAFTGLTAAKEFMNNSLSEGFRIFTCEVKNPRKKPTIIFSFSEVVEYWRLRKQKKKTSHIAIRTKYKYGGSCISCDSIKLLEEVKMKKY